MFPLRLIVICYQIVLSEFFHARLAICQVRGRSIDELFTPPVSCCDLKSHCRLTLSRACGFNLTESHSSAFQVPVSEGQALPQPLSQRYSVWLRRTGCQLGRSSNLKSRKMEKSPCARVSSPSLCHEGVGAHGFAVSDPEIERIPFLFFSSAKFFAFWGRIKFNFGVPQL
jgi:hypothetical protein